MVDIITVGSAIIDLFVDTDRAETKSKICYPIEGKFLVKNLFFSTGGGGLNSAVSLSKLGLKVAYLGNLGKDKNGKVILNELRKAKVKFIGTTSKDNTGFSIILDTKEKHRTILTHKGASDELNLNKIRLKKLKTKWFYFSSMDKSSLEAQKKLIKFASEYGIKIAFIPSMYQLRKGAEYIKGILKRTEILILNKEEASSLVRRDDLLKGLHKLGPKIICITNGEREVIAYDGYYKYSLKPSKVKVVERTGAGDAFSSAFLASFIKTDDIEFSIRSGAINAESVIQKLGSKNGLLTWNELMKKIKKNKVKIKREVY